jgi:hypothetical protein
MANSSSLLPAGRARALLAGETDASKVGKPWNRRMSAATKTKLADAQKALWARAKAGMRRKGRLCLQNVTPSSLAMACGGIDGRKGSDHSHGSMVGAKGGIVVLPCLSAVERKRLLSRYAASGYKASCRPSGRRSGQRDLDYRGKLHFK